MNAMVDVRQTIRRGPADSDEARRIVEMALAHVPSPNLQWEDRLSSALMEMLICRQLHLEAINARVRALAVIDEIENAQRPAADDPDAPGGRQDGGSSQDGGSFRSDH